MKLLYFAWLRTALGTAEEELSPPDEVSTVGDLIAWLRGRGEAYADALADGAKIRAAVNQDFATPDTPVGPQDEVALFPPVTGG